MPLPSGFRSAGEPARRLPTAGTVPAFNLTDCRGPASAGNVFPFEGTMPRLRATLASQFRKIMSVGE